MYGAEDNPGGSFKGSGKPLKKFVKEYKRLGNHVKRYQFSQSYVSGKDVIEFGCGYGAGSFFLRGKYRNYLGLDNDCEAIKYAQTHIEDKFPNTRFKTLKDFENEQHFPEKADVVICYEVFEHVNDVHWLLSFLKTLLRDDGVILLSTPNGLSSRGNKTLFRSQFHVKEYTPSNFYTILSRYGKIEMYGESRIDRIDVRILERRFQDSFNTVKQSTDEKASVPLGNSLFFSISDKFFNSKIFWKIKSVDFSVSTELTCSTLVAVLRPDKADTKVMTAV